MKFTRLLVGSQQQLLAKVERAPIADFAGLLVLVGTDSIYLRQRVFHANGFVVSFLQLWLLLQNQQMIIITH